MVNGCLRFETLTRLFPHLGCQTSSRLLLMFTLGIGFFMIFFITVGSSNCEQISASKISATAAHYFHFDYGDVTFFVIETGSFSSPSGLIDGPEKTLLGTRQFQALKDWLVRSKDEKFLLRFLISPVPFAGRLFNVKKLSIFLGFKSCVKS
jgi:hypothetical protein